MTKFEKIYVVEADTKPDRETTHYFDHGLWGAKRAALGNVQEYLKMGVSTKLYELEIDYSKMKLIKTTEAKPWKEPHFKVGDKGTFQMGLHRITATVVEDRGNLGVSGAQIVSVRTKDFGRFELPTRLLRKKK